MKNGANLSAYSSLLSLVRAKQGQHRDEPGRLKEMLGFDVPWYRLARLRSPEFKLALNGPIRSNL
jgi:hypothetical protein